MLEIVDFILNGKKRLLKCFWQGTDMIRLHFNDSLWLEWNDRNVKENLVVQLGD